MSERRDFGPAAGAMREALANYDRDELADLLTHIVRVFVIEGGTSAASQLASGGETRPASELANLTFAQLVLHLQMNLPHQELSRLKVSGDRVWVERNGREIDLTDTHEDIEQPPDPGVIDRSPTAPEDDGDPFGAPAVRAPGVSIDMNIRPQNTPPPAASGPSQPAQDAPVSGPGSFRPRGSRPASTPAAVAEQAGQVERPPLNLRDEPPVQTRQPPPPSRGDKEAEDAVDDVSDRFSMLELD